MVDGLPIIKNMKDYSLQNSSVKLEKLEVLVKLQSISIPYCK